MARYVLRVAKDPTTDLRLVPLDGEGRPLRDWLMTFHLASVVVDPYTNESSWILPTAVRIMRAFTGAAVRVNFIVTAEADDARTFLGPYAQEFLVFADPERQAVKAFGLERLPAFIFLRADGHVAAAAEGWNSTDWRSVCSAIAKTTAWSKPDLPTGADPAAFRGSPALV